MEFVEHFRMRRVSTSCDKNCLCQVRGPIYNQRLLHTMNLDDQTAEAFANSWNNLPKGSVYSFEQVEDWLAPLKKRDIEGKRVIEFGCGNASLMVHTLSWDPKYLEGIDLGDSVFSAERNLAASPKNNWKITRADLTEFKSDGFDVVYCIGVLHHLKNPKSGFDSMVRNTKRGGIFHGWVYAREGNNIVIYIVDPIRRVASRLPWWVTKYFIATPLVIPYFIYAKLLSIFRGSSLLKKLPLYDYSLWISQRGFNFFRHVAFDQLVTPQTTYIPRITIESWLNNPLIDQSSTYIIMRNGNSWKFGGKIKA